MIEKRAFFTEIRSDGENKTVSGLGIVYDQWTEIWPGYMERINKGAVIRASEVKSFINHDPDKVLSTTQSNPSLRLNDTESGLEYVSPIPPTTYGDDLAVNLERGNIRGSSFSFTIEEGGEKVTRDEDGTYRREISKLMLYEVGPVTNPAYIQTTAHKRSADSLAELVKKAEPTRPDLTELRKRQQKQVEADL